jgi:hypothetical protein
MIVGIALISIGLLIGAPHIWHYLTTDFAAAEWLLDSLGILVLICICHIVRHLVISQGYDHSLHVPNTYSRTSILVAMLGALFAGVSLSLLYRSVGIRIATILLEAGAMSNCLELLRNKQVVNYISIGRYHVNLADILLYSSLGLIVLQVLTPLL